MKPTKRTRPTLDAEEREIIRACKPRPDDSYGSAGYRVLRIITDRNGAPVYDNVVMKELTKIIHKLTKGAR